MISIYNVEYFIHVLNRAATKYRFVFSTTKMLHDCDVIVLFATDSFTTSCSVEKLVSLEQLTQGQNVDIRAYAYDIAAQIRQSLDDKIKKEIENMINDVDRDVYCRLVSGLKTNDSSIYKSSADMPKIKDVIFNSPATIVFWTDGTKTVVKAQYEDFDPEKVLAMAFFKKMHGNKGRYFEEIKKWTEKYEPPKLSESALREVLRKAADGYKGIGAARSRNDILDDLFGPRNADDDE